MQGPWAVDAAHTQVIVQVGPGGTRCIGGDTFCFKHGGVELMP